MIAEVLNPSQVTGVNPYKTNTLAKKSIKRLFMKLKASDFIAMKGEKPISMLTAYNFPVAQCLEKAGIPILLVGDTLAMVEMGFDSTRHVTIENMCYHVSAVSRGAPDTHIIGDLPYKTYENPEGALQNSRALLDSGADSVKLEGPSIEVIKHLVDSGIDVVGHIGLLPQTAANFKQVGRTEEERNRVLAEAKLISESGVFLLVLEHIPSDLGEEITKTIDIPTIGIGAGPKCDGQVLVTNDLLGIGEKWPPFSKQYTKISEIIAKAVESYKHDVESGKFPE